MNVHSTYDAIGIRLASVTPAEAPEIRLFVIVPVFGNWADTIDCLRMLAEQDPNISVRGEARRALAAWGKEI